MELTFYWNMIADDSLCPFQDGAALKATRVFQMSVNRGQHSVLGKVSGAKSRGAGFGQISSCGLHLARPAIPELPL
jgi:hypothetical protein